MPKNNHQIMLFKAFSPKKIEVDFKGGKTCSDAGLLLLREAEKNLGLFQKIADIIPDQRHPGYVKHEVKELLTQRVLQIAAGYEDASDSNFLRDDPILKIACESEKPLASQPTMSRFENGLSRTTLYRMAEALLEIFIASYAQAPEGIILDFDDTGDRTYGHQQLSLFNSYHNGYCYMPMHIYEGKSGKLITTILRPGKRPSGAEITMILKRIVRKIRKAWPKVGIILRGDAHYGAPKVYEYCERHGIKYVLGFKSYEPLTEKAQELINQAKQLYEASQEPVRLFSEFEYQAGSWSKSRRIIVKAEHNEKGSNTRFIVTNLEHKRPGLIYKIVYSGRGAMELMIKAHKTHLNSDRTSCHRFEANQFRVFLHSMAYIILHHFRERYLWKTGFAKSQFDTIREKLLKIGAQVHYLATKIKIHLPSSYPFQNEFRQVYQLCINSG